MFNNNQNKKIIDRFTINPSIINVKSLVQVAKSEYFEIEDIKYLATKLAHSGEHFLWNYSNRIYDIPSTGGPSSLSTLICPLILASYDKKVIKLGVPGRPAGGIDVLAQIKKYKYNYNFQDLKKLSSNSKYIHILANKYITPLDILLFNYRKLNNELNVPNLVIASILAKKIAMGVTDVGLDIRVSRYGNFGYSYSEAKKNAKKFNQVSMAIGINSKCFLTNGNVFQQPYIGRGESILALSKFFTNNQDLLLKNHFDDCIKMSLNIINEKARVKDNLTGLMFEEFKSNILFQKGDLKSFFNLAKKIEQSHLYQIKASASGLLSINLQNIRNVICLFQSKNKAQEFVDNCGIILKCNDNSIVSKGDLLATFRCSKEFKKEFEIKINECLLINEFYYDKKNVLIM